MIAHPAGKSAEIQPKNVTSRNVSRFFEPAEIAKILPLRVLTHNIADNLNAAETQLSRPPYRWTFMLPTINIAFQAGARNTAYP